MTSKSGERQSRKRNITLDKVERGKAEAEKLLEYFEDDTKCVKQILS